MPFRSFFLSNRMQENEPSTQVNGRAGSDDEIENLPNDDFEIEDVGTFDEPKLWLYKYSVFFSVTSK